MKIKILRNLLLTLAILTMGCECPTNIDDSTVIKPTVYANMLFINAMPEQNLNQLFVLSTSKVVERVDTIYYDSLRLFTPYYLDYLPLGIKIAGKKNTLKLAKTERNALGDTIKILFNSVLSIDKDSHYTFIAYGAEESVQSILLKDDLSNPKPENTYIRCINVSPDAPIMYLTITTEGYSRSFSLASGNASEIANSPSGDYTLTLTSGDSSIKNLNISNVKFSKGKINNVIFRGAFKGTSVNPREVIIVTGNYPY